MRAWLVAAVPVAAVLYGLGWWAFKTNDAMSDESAPGAAPPPQACVSGTPNKLCSTIPHDVVEKFMAGYSQLGAAQQRPFDNFSWQSFVALNWPADNAGKPLPVSITTNPTAPRVWEFYPTPDDVFGGPNVEGVGKTQPAKSVRRFRMMATRSNFKDAPSLPDNGFLEATGQALIDSSLNFVMYDIVMNPVEATYIKSNGLDTLAGQKKFKDAGKKVNFPVGYYADPSKALGGSVGAMEIKTAWRLLDPAKDKMDRFYVVDGVIHIDAKNSVTGKAFTVESKMGLVGMHIIQRTKGPYLTDGTPMKQDWIWSTFEHVDNAPEAGNARAATDINLPLPAQATAPMGPQRQFSFYNGGYHGPTNAPPQPRKGETDYKWNPTAPYAALYANEGKYGTQVVRAWKVYPPTEEVNVYFQNLLKGSVWQNYKLIGSQWMGGTEAPQVQNGNIPRYLSNTTLETYIQFNSAQQRPPVQPEGSCITCHGFATTAAGQPANFSFLLGRAR